MHDSFPLYDVRVYNVAQISTLANLPLAEVSVRAEVLRENHRNREGMSQSSVALMRRASSLPPSRVSHLASIDQPSICSVTQR